MFSSSWGVHCFSFFSNEWPISSAISLRFRLLGSPGCGSVVLLTSSTDNCWRPYCRQFGGDGLIPRRLPFDYELAELTNLSVDSWHGNRDYQRIHKSLMVLSAKTALMTIGHLAVLMGFFKQMSVQRASISSWCFTLSIIPCQIDAPSIFQWQPYFAIPAGGL